LGDSEFIGYFAYVQRDIGGLGAAPQGEKQPITAYTGVTGDIVIANAYTAPLQVGDEILLLHPILLSGSGGGVIPPGSAINVLTGDSQILYGDVFLDSITVAAGGGLVICGNCFVLNGITNAGNIEITGNAFNGTSLSNASTGQFYIGGTYTNLGTATNTAGQMVFACDCMFQSGFTNTGSGMALFFGNLSAYIGITVGAGNPIFFVFGDCFVLGNFNNSANAVGIYGNMSGIISNGTGYFAIGGNFQGSITNTGGHVEVDGNCLGGITQNLGAGGHITVMGVFNCSILDNDTGSFVVAGKITGSPIFNNSGTAEFGPDSQLAIFNNYGTATGSGSFGQFIEYTAGVFIPNGDCSIENLLCQGTSSIAPPVPSAKYDFKIGSLLNTGSGSITIPGDFNVTQDITNSNGGTLTVLGNMTVIGILTNGPGTITVKAIGYLYGTVNNTGTLTYNLPSVGGGGGLGEIHMGITVAPAGNLTINNDVLCIGDVNVGAGATLTINGNLHVTGDFTADDGTMIMIYGNCFIAANISGLTVGNGTDGTMVVLSKLEIGSNTGTGIVINAGAGLFTGDCRISGGSATLNINSQLGTANLEIARILSANVDGVVITVAGDCKVADTFRLGNGTSGDCTITGTLSAGSLSTKIGTTLVVGGDTTVQGYHGEEGAPIFNGDLRVIGIFQIMSSASVIINGNLDAVGGIILSTGSLTSNNIFAGAAGIEITASSSLASADCICEGTFIANVDGVTITIGGNCLIYDNFSLGGGTSGACLVAGNFKAIGATIAAGASCVIGGHAEPGGISGLGTFIYIYGVQPEDSVDFPADNVGEDVLNLGGGVGIHYKVKSLWLNFTDPVAAHYTVELSQFINGSLMVVKTTTVNTPGGFYNLMDLFGIPELSGDSIEIRATLSVAGPLAVTGSYVYEVE